MQRVNGEERAGQDRGKRGEEHAADDQREQDGDSNVEGDVDNMVAEGAELVKVVVESEGYGG